jgi:hypothetical protein
MAVQLSPPSRETTVDIALKYVMRVDGKVFSGTCACTTSAPDFVHNIDGCNPRGRTIRSGPNSTFALPSDSIISGWFVAAKAEKLPCRMTTARIQLAFLIG